VAEGTVSALAQSTQMAGAVYPQVNFRSCAATCRESGKLRWSFSAATSRAIEAGSIKPMLPKTSSVKGRIPDFLRRGAFSADESGDRRIQSLKPRNLAMNSKDPELMFSRRSGGLAPLLGVLAFVILTPALFAQPSDKRSCAAASIFTSELSSHNFVALADVI
jgi:hypothetical protein